MKLWKQKELGAMYSSSKRPLYPLKLLAVYKIERKRMLIEFIYTKVDLKRILEEMLQTEDRNKHI